MNITIIAVGRIGNSIEAELVNRYCNRFNKLNKFLGFDPLQIVEIDDKKFKTKTLQGKKISEIVNKNLNQVLCDTNGKMMSSEDFTKFLTIQRDTGVKNLFFVIGGAFGLCSSLYKKDIKVFSLGKMIWPHLLARALLTEQIYRSASIMLGNPYHKS